MSASISVGLLSLRARSMARMVVARTGLHFTDGMEHGVRAIGRFLWWSNYLKATPDLETPEPISPSILDYPASGIWSETQGRTLLQKAGISIVPGRLATSAEAAVEAARSLGMPAVLKIQSPDLPHKSDIGGVTLNIASTQDIHTAFTAMLNRVRSAQPGAKIEGILVSPMRPTRLELLVGIVRDPLWGPVLTVGIGGVWTEILKDTAVRVLPVGRREIEAMLGELRGAALLRGARGQAGIDLQELSAVIARISALALALGPTLSALEINPLLVSPERIEALDVLVSWQT